MDGEGIIENVPYIQGSKGNLFPGFRSDIPNLKKKLAEFPEPEEQVVDFSYAVKNRLKFALNEENGHRSCTLINMALVALRLGRGIMHFDSVSQTFVKDEAANRLIDPPMRAPWTV
ncbi:hypothetical protein D3C87_1555060 [compost metagenome]